MQGIRKVMAWLVVPFTAAVIGVMYLTSAPAHALATPIFDYVGPISSQSAPNECLDVANAFGQEASNLSMQIWTCGGGNNHYADEIFAYDSANQELVYVDASGKTDTCVIPSSSPTYNRLITGDCASAVGSVWRQTAVSGSGYKYVQFHFGSLTGPVMDIKGNGTTSGTPVGSFSNTGGTNQQWHTVQQPGVAAQF